jgi:hypothetical protein
MAEVATYLTFRMRAAGYKGPDVFDPQAVARIARASGGLTRRINILADKALLAAFSGSTHAVGAKQARAAIADSEFAPHARKRGSLAGLAAAATAGALASAGAYWLVTQTSPAPAVASAPAAAPTPAPAAALAPASPAVLASTAAPKSPVSRLEREQVLRLSDYDARRNALLFARLEATREKLDTVPDERHSLELYITDNSDAARVERFLLRARDLVPLENLWIVPVESGGRYRIWALYGDFPGRDEAVQAARRLPPKYQEAFALVPRSFAEVRRPL